MLILICSLINISKTNSPIEIKNLKSVNDGKRILNEQIDNYIIIEFNETVTYEGGQFLNNGINYNQYISYIINGNETIDRNSNFIAKKKNKLIVHFNQTFKSLESFFDAGCDGCDGNFIHLILVDFCHFDTSSVTNMVRMFYDCHSLQTLLSDFNTTSVTDMAKMFSHCFSIQTLNLSNFNTSLVTNMVDLFKECTSLKYLIISNFNFDKVEYYTGIFDDLQNLEYIDIYNIEDINGVLKGQVYGLNEKDNLIVCQNNKDIITNQNAINNCSYIIDEILSCNNILTTIPLIQTTNLMIQTINPLIQTTIPLIRTTIPIIHTTIPIIQTTIPLIQTTINQIETIIPQIQNTSLDIRNEETLLILLGFNSFKLSSSTISFKVLFTQILNNIYSNLMKVHLTINYNEKIRILEEKEIDCYLKKINNKKIASYLCETEIKNSNIKQVKINQNLIL